ncbi:MAG: hypothetical protein QHI48_06185 [Bacteroidota bacterium]|nr:hypothetical protein [Bacteroidota bacterium]
MTDGKFSVKGVYGISPYGMDIDSPMYRVYVLFIENGKKKPSSGIGEMKTGFQVIEYVGIGKAIRVTCLESCMSSSRRESILRYGGGKESHGKRGAS